MLGLLAPPLVLYLLVQALAVLIGREKQLAEEQVCPLNPHFQLTLLCLLLTDPGVSGGLCDYKYINCSLLPTCGESVFSGTDGSKDQAVYRYCSDGRFRSPVQRPAAWTH